MSNVEFYKLADNLRKYASSKELTFALGSGWEKLRDLLNDAANRLDELENNIALKR